VIRIKEDTFVSARAVDIIRIAPACPGGPYAPLEVQVWCGVNCLNLDERYQQHFAPDVERARQSVADLVAAVELELREPDAAG
jgi:hypothetical protein